jgi:hypothetical protein
VLAHELLVSGTGGSGRLAAGPQLLRPVGEVAGGSVLTLLVRLIVLAQHLLHGRARCSGYPARGLESDPKPDPTLKLHTVKNLQNCLKRLAFT